MKNYLPKAEPVAWLAAVTTVTALAVYFLHVSPSGSALITGAVVSILGIFTRGKVSPTA